MALWKPCGCLLTLPLFLQSCVSSLHFSVYWTSQSRHQVTSLPRPKNLLLLLLLIWINLQHGLSGPSDLAPDPALNTNQPSAASPTSFVQCLKHTGLLPILGLYTCFSPCPECPHPCPQLPKEHLAHLDYPWDHHLNNTTSEVPQCAGVSPSHSSAVLMIWITIHSSTLYSLMWCLVWCVFLPDQAASSTRERDRPCLFYPPPIS